MGHDFVFRGANLSLQGRIAGAADVTSGGTDANNSVQPWMFQSFAFSRDMPAWPTVPAGLTFGENANIGGQLDYTSPQAVTIPASAAGNVKFTPMPVNSTGSNSGVVALAPYTIGNWLLDQLRSFIALAVAGLLLVWLLPAFLKNAAQQLAVKPLPSLGWGFVIAIMVPVGAVVLLTAATIIAVALGFLTLGNLGGTLIIATVAALFSGLVAFSLAMAYVTKIIVAYWLGHWVLSKLSPGQATSPIVAMLVGLLPLVLLTGIPMVGWLISLVITLMGLGAVWLMWRRTPSPMSMSLPTPSLAPLPTATLNVSAQQPV